MAESHRKSNFTELTVNGNTETLPRKKSHTNELKINENRESLSRRSSTRIRTPVRFGSSRPGTTSKSKSTKFQISAKKSRNLNSAYSDEDEDTVEVRHCFYVIGCNIPETKIDLFTLYV